MENKLQRQTRRHVDQITKYGDDYYPKRAQFKLHLAKQNQSVLA